MVPFHGLKIFDHLKIIIIIITFWTNPSTSQTKTFNVQVIIQSVTIVHGFKKREIVGSKT